jgi:hypothetical protein
MGCFGGVATISLVNIWHPPFDAHFEKQIFAGLTTETMDRLALRRSVNISPRNPHAYWIFNSHELMIELDEMVRETEKVTPYLHTLFAAPYIGNDGRLAGVFVENKTGRGVIKAKVFIDATGDGDLCARLGLETYSANQMQPSTTCALLASSASLHGVDVQGLVRKHGDEFGFPQGYIWSSTVPGSDIAMLAGTRVKGRDCSDGDALTAAEMEGRRQVRALQDLLRKYAPDGNWTLAGLPARIGIRESRHVRCHHAMTQDDVLGGAHFDDAIAFGAYPVDIHHVDKPGITKIFLDGTQVYSRDGFPAEKSRWLPENSDSAAYYQIPYRSLQPLGAYDNLLLAGRMIDADVPAHGAIRVMVNMNQTGEAAGVAATMAIGGGGANVRAVEPAALRAEMARGGSLMM